MTELTANGGGRNANPWRIAGWGFAAALLLAPFVAMRMNVEGVDWSPFDFVAAAFLIGIPGLLFELAVRLSGNWAYRAGAALALLISFLTVWINLAVGIVGDEDNPANLMFFAVVFIALAGSVLAGFKPAGMARALFIAALVQAGIGAVVWFGRMETAAPAAGLSLALALMWLAAGGLFRRATKAATT